MDIREIDSFGRRKTIIVAIDALRSPGLRQYRVDSLLRFGFLIFFCNSIKSGKALAVNQFLLLMTSQI